MSSFKIVPLNYIYRLILSKQPYILYLIGGQTMNNKQEQFLNYILKRVQDGKVDEAQALINENFKKQEAGTFTHADIGEFIPKITMLIKPNHVDEVHNVIQEFAATFSEK